MRTQYTQIQYDGETNSSYMEFAYQTGMSLDPDVVLGLRAAGIEDVESEIIELVVERFRQTLKIGFIEELKKRGMPL